MERVKIKICGLTRPEDVRFLAEMDIDFAGFIFVPGTPRCLDPQKAVKLTGLLPTNIRKVGVFRNQDPEVIRDIIRRCRLDLVQLHGSESPVYCRKLEFPYFKVIRVKDTIGGAEFSQYGPEAFLLDTYSGKSAGGTGETFNWELARNAKKFHDRIVLAGGLTAQNVNDAVRTVRPWGVDVSSGVESAPGIKDHEKLQEFVGETRK